jgi:hypothetical protein
MAKILESELVKPDGNKYFTIEWDSAYTIGTPEHFTEFCEQVHSHILDPRDVCWTNYDFSYNNQSAYNAVYANHSLLQYLVEHYPDEESTWSFVHKALSAGLTYGTSYLDLSREVLDTGEAWDKTNKCWVEGYKLVPQGKKILDKAAIEIPFHEKNDNLSKKLEIVMDMIISKVPNIWDLPHSQNDSLAKPLPLYEPNNSKLTPISDKISLPPSVKTKSLLHTLLAGNHDDFQKISTQLESKVASGTKRSSEQVSPPQKNEPLSKILKTAHNTIPEDSELNRASFPDYLDANAVIAPPSSDDQGAEELAKIITSLSTAPQLATPVFANGNQNITRSATIDLQKLLDTNSTTSSSRIPVYRDADVAKGNVAVFSRQSTVSPGNDTLSGKSEMGANLSSPKQNTLPHTPLVTNDLNALINNIWQEQQALVQENQIHYQTTLANFAQYNPPLVALFNSDNQGVDIVEKTNQFQLNAQAINPTTSSSGVLPYQCIDLTQEPYIDLTGQDALSPVDWGQSII